MIHDIKCAGKYHDILAALQETGVELLEAVAKSAPIDTADTVVKTLNNLYGGYGDWLASKPVAIMAHVISLLALFRKDQAAYRQAVSAVHHDVDWPEDEAAQATFSFQWSTVGAELRKPIKDLFHSLFEVILEDKNFRKKRFGPKEPEHGKARQVRLFKTNHKDLDTVCPACDLVTYGQVRNDNHLHEDLDHYLPKQHYPPLAVAPKMLVPICDPCNRKGKRANDPLQGIGVGGLTRVFLPYLRPGRDEIALDLRRWKNVQYPVLKNLVSKQGTALAHERVRRLDQTFSLKKRWKPLMKNIDREFRRHMGHLEPSGGWTKAEVTRAIQKLLTEVQPFVGTQAQAVIFRCYLEWAAQQPPATIIPHLK